MSKRPQPSQSDQKKSGKNKVKREDTPQQEPEAVSYDELVKIEEEMDVGIPRVI
jgi:hypothetical protein